MVLLVLFLTCSLDAQEPKIQGRLEVIEGQKTLFLWGTSKERGFAHGWLLGETLVRDLDGDLNSFLKTLLPVYETVLLKAVVPAFQFTADEEEEISGIFEGLCARVPQEKRFIPTLKRELRLADLKAINTVGDWVALGCSSFAVESTRVVDGGPAVARNFDFMGLRLLLENQVIIVSGPREGEFGYAGITHPGGIGITTGMNSEGVFVSIHDVPIRASLSTAKRKNAPRLVVLRRLLQTTAAKGAVHAAHKKLKEWPTLYGNNFMVVTPDAGDGPYAGVLEYDHRLDLDAGVTLRALNWKDASPEPFLVCSNHHRVRARNEEESEGHCTRYDRMHSRLIGRGKDLPPLSENDLFEIANVAAVPRAERVQKPLHHGTLHQVVAFTGKRRLFIKMGVPEENIRNVKSRILDVPEALSRIPSDPVPAGLGGG